ncbi:MAG: hypothetical protein KAU31_10395, partial [Spirochaetaceae bacterium]|nr:hypothetical protein [Spirochaetaceae bacterium]
MSSESTERQHADHYRPIFIEDPNRAREEVLALWEDRIGPVYRRLVDEAIADVQALFAGRVSGYKASNTPYHTLSHTVMVFVAMGRILDGASRNGVVLSPHDVGAGLLAAIYHDTGYIQDADDEEGTGAKHTVGHEHRSVRQLERFLGSQSMRSSIMRPAGAAIAHTEIHSGTGGRDSTTQDQHAAMEQRLGTYLMYADLFGQMADRAYLEKLLLLYQEFHEAGFTQYKSEWDVLEGTSGFVNQTISAPWSAADEISRLLEKHFEHRLRKRHDLYRAYIRKNLSYLEMLLQEHPTDYRNWLRRNGVVANLSDV